MVALKPLIYFSLFNYPLTDEEVFLFSETKDKKEISEDINSLLEKGIINRIDNFLLLEKDEQQIHKRINGNKEADAIMPKAENVAKFISKFPFVKSVAISGSLSKRYFDNESDFDFFIITKAKRVWICRMLIAFYKRMFLSNSYKEFCVNYFVSTETLEIEEKNRFTATEIATVIPVYGKVDFTKFYDKNLWVKDFFPNINLKHNLNAVKPIEKVNTIKFLEFMLDNFLGKFMNYLCMKIITRKWKKRYKSKVNTSYKSKKEISKHHPENFQDKVIKNLNIKYKSCEKTHGIHIPEEHV
jgi:hypothetical protein